uniref:Ig-like domain-containing protein n=1 Tax=Sparus aurata TaxID=8175 RepID=A0A671UZM5_SPAAU
MVNKMFLLVSTVIHSLRYAHTGSSEIPNVPDTVAVVIVDGYQTNHYDSITRKMVPTQTWMSRVSEDDPDYWERETSFWRDQEQYARMHIEFYKERFNQSGGIHVLQVSHGCEWDDETGEVHGFDVVRYDGEDVLILDVKARRWIAMKPQALSYQHRYNKDEGWLEFMDHRLLKECPESLKKSLDYGKSTLQRTVTDHPPEFMSCLATGFYPHRAAIFWRKDGEEIHEQVDHGELLNNHDGSFQMSHWFSSPGLHVEVSLGKILNPKLLLMCWPVPCMAATTISVSVYVSITVSLLWTKASDQWPKCKSLTFTYNVN